MGSPLEEEHDLSSYNFIDQLINLDFVDEILLYGSRSRGSHLPRSDIDLAIVCPKATRMQWHQVLKIIEEADTLLEIDCVRFDEIQTEVFKEAIIRDAQILYRKGPCRITRLCRLD